LARLGLCFNQFLSLVICLECSCALGSKAIEPHLHDVHKEEHFRIDHTKLKQALVDLNVKESFSLAKLPSNCPQIEGLYLLPNAYLCGICQHIRGTLQSIQKHHRTAHSNSPMPVSWTRTTAQQLHHNNDTPYFRVIPRNIPTDNNDVATQFFLSHNKNREKTVANYDISKMDPRQVSIWLKATKWHILVAPYDHQHLLSLVSKPTKAEKELENLGIAVNTYTRKADQVMDTLSYLALCIINSPQSQ